MALRARTPLLLAGVVMAFLLSNAAVARVLLTLDDFGAVGDGIANDTQAFVDAWAAACATGDNTYFNVPAGKSYLIWPVTLAGPCQNEIKLLISGNITAPESPDEWPCGDQGKWLHFTGVSNLAVSGGGIIDGRGQQWWAQSENTTAPKALHFEDCQDISVKGITVQNSQREHLAFTRCSNVEANYLRVASPEHSPGTVGVLLVSSVNVHIMDDLFSVGGDCVSIMGNCTDVRLSAISCGAGHGISIGGLGENGSLHKIEKIKMDTMFISNTKYGVRVKTYEGGSGVARKVKFSQIVMKNVSNPIIIDQHYSTSNRGTPCITPNASAVAVEEIDYIDITGTSATEWAVTFACSDAIPCNHLSLKRVNLTKIGGGSTSAYCYQAFGASIGDVLPESCLGEEVDVDDDDGDDDDGDDDDDDDDDNDDNDDGDNNDNDDDDDDDDDADDDDDGGGSDDDEFVRNSSVTKLLIDPMM